MLNKKFGKVRAIIWDYDGTLVDTRQKNLNVTRKIISKVSGTNWNKYSVLNTLDNYHLAHIKTTNWREFYKDNFGFDNNQIDATGTMWTAYQLDDQTPLLFIDGVEDVVKSLQSFPQGIVSQNSREIITNFLKEKDLISYFKSVIGYEEVDLSKQKPHPDGLLMCVGKLTDSKPGIVIYIGDHETDVRCAFNANKELKGKNASLKIITIGAIYGHNANNSKWEIQPDYIAAKTEDITNIISVFETI